MNGVCIKKNMEMQGMPIFLRNIIAKINTMGIRISKMASITYENIWLRNIVFISLIFSTIYLTSKINPSPPAPQEQSYIQIFIFLISKYFFIFVHNHFLIRLLLFKKKYRFYFLSAFIYLTLFAIVDFAVTSGLGFPTYLFTEYISSLLISIFGLAFYIIHTWILNNIIKTKKELLDKKNELDFLKHQISPHFLFNAINNLYGVALTSPQIIADKLLELSDLLRYQIEAVKKDLVTIEDEMNFIKNYINYTKSKTNNLEISNNIEGIYNSVFIPPLLFLPLIENAIKYCVETDNAFIRSTWKFEKNQLILTVENSYLKMGSKIKGTKSGIENLTNRLELLRMKYDLKIDTSIENVYKAELKLWELSVNA
jgi:hypothetical protein